MPDTLSNPAVGIDLGTTYSVIAYINRRGVPETIPNAEGELLTPSMLLFEADEVVVGKEAAKAQATEFHKIADCPKRFVGQRLYNKSFGGRRYPPEALQGWILNKLRHDARRVIGDFRHAVITVPAYFDEVRRKATQDAGFIAGLEVRDIINEPTAAALAYGFQSGWLDESGMKGTMRFLVYDLGGGTFDVTLMEVNKLNFKTLATDGDVMLGGRDWDQKLVDFVADSFLETHAFDPRQNSDSLGRLLRDAKDAKETLSTRSRASIDCLLGTHRMKLEITRDQFQRMTQDLLDRTDFTVRQTLKSAGLGWSDIDRVLLVGGATRMPAVSAMLRSLSGKEPDISLSPDEAVAHGAALRSAMIARPDSNALPKATIQNVNSHSLGIVANEIETGIAQVVTLIPRNTPLPVVARRVFKTHRQDRESILVQIVEGESRNPEDCTKLGRCAIWNLPESLPIGSLIEVKFTYEENGRLKIKVKIGGEERRAFRYELQRPNSLTDEQLQSWRDYICGPEKAR